MDTELLSRMVGELVLDHDVVGLPGLGSFVVEEVPASFSDRGYTVNPPYRRLSFKAGRPEDESLIAMYATSNGIDMSTSRAILADYVAQLKEVLIARKAVSLPGLGRLRATRDNKFFFVPDEGLDIFPEGVALEPVSLKTHIETSEEVSIAVSNLSAILANASPEPEPVVEPEPVAAPEPEPAPVSEPHHEHHEHHHHHHRLSWWAILLIVLAALAILGLGTFLILSRVAPDFIDSILYTPEELRILHYYQ